MPDNKAGKSAGDYAPKHIDNRHGQGPIFQESVIREIINAIYNQTKQGTPENTLDTGSCSWNPRQNEKDQTKNDEHPNKDAGGDVRTHASARHPGQGSQLQPVKILHDPCNPDEINNDENK
jgi:hypothetical protein